MRFPVAGTVAAIAASALAAALPSAFAAKRSPEQPIHPAALQPFPAWLTATTGLTEWPGAEPPYVPLGFLDMAKIPNLPPRAVGECPADRTLCLFDCFKCVAPDDVYTCPKLSQTFDDGPLPVTPKLLAHLKTPTTFFTLGLNVVRFPDTYRTTAAAGHVMGSHTWLHPFLPLLTNEQLVAQVQWSVWAMNATGGHLPRWFRPPYGGVDERVRHVVRQFGMQCVLWDLDTFDWQVQADQRSETQVLADVARWTRARPRSGLVLEHDVYLKTVNAGIKVAQAIGPDQMTVPQCVGGQDYLKVFQ